MHPRPFTYILSLLLSLAIPLQCLAQTITLPDIGDPSRQYLSPFDERRLGATVVKRLRDRGLIIDDVQSNEYLASLGQKIAVYADYRDNPFTFLLVRNSSINAFAAPGAFIGVYSGLVLATQSESELAGVVAHEIAHISQRHIARAFADARRMDIPMAAALLASILVAAASPQAGQAAITGTMALGAQHRIDFTRAHEQEADRIGTQLLTQAGFDPNGLATFFNRLERLSGGNNAQLPEYLRTHPLPRSRIADTQNRFGTQAPRQTPKDSIAYSLTKARLQVLTGDNTHALIRHFKTALTTDESQNRAAARYGYALALKRAGRYDEAHQQIAPLLKADPDRLAFRLEEAEIALAKGNKAQAWQLFEDVMGLYPDDFTLAMHYGRALAVQGDPRKAMQLLQPYVRQRSTYATLYTVYAQAAQRAGDTTATHAAMAEYYYLSGELNQAIEQAELGLRNPSATPYQQAQLRARLRQFKEEAIREQS